MIKVWLVTLTDENALAPIANIIVAVKELCM